MFTYARGITYGLLYKLTMTCPDRHDLKASSWLYYDIIYIRVRFIASNIGHPEIEVVPNMSDLQIALANPERDLRKVSYRSTATSFIHASNRSGASIDTFQGRSKRLAKCNGIGQWLRKKKKL